ncbi:hypothetical protein DER45DRAFT_550963 [Fusarium avenaceum]|nr:hypothetical protein DER45DRAFT_550963 [Fusarium avenaceum]
MPATIGTFLFSSLARGTVPCRRLSSQAAPSHERTRRLCRAGCGWAVKARSNVFEIGDKNETKDSFFPRGRACDGYPRAHREGGCLYRLMLCPCARYIVGANAKEMGAQMGMRGY